MLTDVSSIFVSLMTDEVALANIPTARGTTPQLLGSLQIQEVKKHELHEDKIGHGPPKFYTLPKNK